MNAILQLARNNRVTAEMICAAISSSPECMAVVENGVVIYANPAFARLFKYETSPIAAGTSLSDFIPGDRACTRRNGVVVNGKTRECGYPSCDFETEKLDGTRLQVEAVCASFRFENRDLRVIHVRDISYRERRRVVRDSDKRFRAVVDEAAIGILQITIDGHIVESNPAAERILGYLKNELRGMAFHNLLYAEDLNAGEGLFQDLVEGRHEHYRREVRFRRKDQGWGWARLTVSLVRGPDTRPEFAILMIEDVTEYKRAEQQLRVSHKMEAIGRLAGGVAHDFNNLLTGIMLYSDLLRTGLENDHRLRMYVDEIRLASEHGGALIQQLLALAKKQVVEPRIISLNEIVCGMQDLLSRLIGEQIDFITKLHPGLWPVKMDPTQVQQVLMNLAINARDSMPDGGTIVVSTRNVPLAEDSGAPRVELTVEDTGCGMSPEILSRVFEPFFTTKSSEHGNGLGLSTVHNIVQESGGAIDIKSHPGEGTRVTIRLAPVDAKPSASTIVGTNHTAGCETILLVEDNEVVRKSAKSTLRQCGYRVMEASNGKEALEVFRKHRKQIRLLLTDLMLPGSNGHEVAKHIHQINPDLPVIFTTGYEETGRARENDESVVVFRKPFAGDALAMKVRQELDRKTKVFSDSDQPTRKSV